MMAVNKLCITDKVSFGLNDGDMLPLERCVCGEEFEPWTFNLHTDADDSNQCDICGRKMWFSVGITVWQEAPPEVVLQGDDYTQRPEETSILVEPRTATPLSEAMDEWLKKAFTGQLDEGIS